MNRRSYHQFCGLAKALDVVGERWTLLIVRNLLLGPLRYSDLLHGLPGLTTNLLAKRLKEMAEQNLIEKTRTAPSERSFVYRLTPLGRGLEPVVHALGRWGQHRMDAQNPDDARNLEWLFVSLGRRYRGTADLTAEVVAADVPYRFVLTSDGADIRRGSASAPDLRLRGEPPALAPLFLHGLPADGLPDGVELDGSPDSLAQLLNAFAEQPSR